MKVTINNCIFKSIRFCARCFTRRYRVCSPDETASPAVYLVHHQNLRGPLLSMFWLNIPVRLWVLYVFCSHKTCFRHYYNYTFTKRFGLPKWVAAVVSFLLSLVIPGLMHVIDAIPVFRGSKSIIRTFRQSISTLAQGRDILINPDIDYKDTSTNIGEMYDGFLYLEKYYMKETGRHLAFVPLYISKAKHTINIGNPVYFGDGKDFKEEKANAYSRLKQEFLRLEKHDGQFDCTNKTDGVPLN